MKNRFYSPAPLAVGATIELDPGEAHHARVLRLREREEVEVFDSTAHNFAARVSSVAKDRVSIEILAMEDPRELRAPLTLALALIQPDKFELVLQKATELGARRIVPIVAAHCEVRPERVAGKRDRWEKIVLEAVKQSGRAQIPRIAEPVELADAIRAGGACIVFDASAPRQALEIDASGATLFIGPEGGWSEDEIALARRLGCRFQNLGPRRLRAETAAIAALAAAGSLLGETSG
jgi:16S rRNA (uracil1498-N3)-methyltransferase